MSIINTKPEIAPTPFPNEAPAPLPHISTCLTHLCLAEVQAGRQQQGSQLSSPPPLGSPRFPLRPSRNLSPRPRQDDLPPAQFVFRFLHIPLACCHLFLFCVLCLLCSVCVCLRLFVRRSLYMCVCASCCAPRL